MDSRGVLTSMGRHLPFGWVMVWGLAPWLLAPLALGKWGVAAAAVAMICLATGSGWLFLGAPWSARLQPQLRIVFAPGVGAILVCGAFYAVARFGGPVSPVVWVVLATGGTGFARFSQAALTRRREVVRHGFAMVLLSWSVCVGNLLITALPVSYVFRSDGSYSCMHTDVQYDMAVASSLSISTPPAMPGMSVKPLKYHYASHTIPAFFSRVLGFELTDALLGARILLLLALFCAALGWGAVVASLQNGKASLGAILGVVGVFGLGTGSEILAKLYWHLGGARDMSGWPVVASADLIWGLSLGRPVVWGFMGILVVLGLALAASRQNCGMPVGLALLAVLVMPLNVFSGLGLCGALSGAVLLTGLRRRRAWIWSACLAVAAFGTLAAMSDSQGGTTLLRWSGRGTLVDGLVVMGQRLQACSWWLVGLGLGVSVFALVFQRRTRLAGWLLALLTAEGIALAVLFAMACSNETYLLGPVHHLLIATVLPLMARPLQAGLAADMSVLDALIGRCWRCLAVAGLANLICVGGFFLLARHSRQPALPTSMGLVAAAFVVVIAFAALAVTSSSRGSVRWLSRVAFALMLGACAFTPLTTFARHATRRFVNQVDVSSGVVAGLLRLKAVSQVSDLCATDRPASAMPVSGKARASGYVYIALAERRFLICEGVYGESSTREFGLVNEANRHLFETGDAAQAVALVRKYGIRFLVCAPGADLGLAPALPEWLERVPDSGTLKIYRVRD